MGATVWCDTIYISKDLSSKITQRERKVLLAHELAHYYRKDRLRILGVMIGYALLTLLAFIAGLVIAAWTLMAFSGVIIVAFIKHIEIEADKFALKATNDPEAFKSLMDKLSHGGTHPTKQARNRLAEEWGKNELN